MISIECSKRKKCPAVKKLLGDTRSQKVGHCEFCFNLVNGSETFCTPDGKIQQSAFFQIQADSENERAQRIKCLHKKYGKENTTVFESIPGKNPIIDWELTPENLMRLNACAEQLYDYGEQIREMFDPGRKLKPFEPNSDLIEIWSRFIHHRLTLSKNKSMSIEYLNDTAVEYTEEDIEDLGSEENLAGLRYIADGLNKDNEQAS